MGDAENLGSRLEGITKQYGVGIIVSDSTKAQVKDVLYRELDRVRVKGKDEPVGIFEPLGLSCDVEPARQDEVKLWNQALRYYRQQDWDAAELQLINLLRQSPGCYLYQLYAKRVAHCRANLTGYKVPRQVEFRKDLPKSNVGKILRRELRDGPASQK